MRIALYCIIRPRDDSFAVGENISLKFLQLFLNYF